MHEYCRNIGYNWASEGTGLDTDVRTTYWNCFGLAWHYRRQHGVIFSCYATRTSSLTWPFCTLWGGGMIVRLLPPKPLTWFRDRSDVTCPVSPAMFVVLDRSSRDLFESLRFVWISYNGFVWIWYKPFEWIVWPRSLKGIYIIYIYINVCIYHIHIFIYSYMYIYICSLFLLYFS